MDDPAHDDLACRQAEREARRAHDRPHPPERRALNREAFAALYDAVAPALLRWLRRQVEPEVARDLLAESFAQAWAQRSSFDPARGDGGAWLFGIARNLLHAYWRRQAVETRARRRLGVDLDIGPSLAPDVEQALDLRALRGTLETALAALPGPTREAVLLRVVAGADYRTIAARLGCTSATARMRVTRGLRALRDRPDLGPAVQLLRCEASP